MGEPFWKKRARDTIALGSWTFYTLVLARIMILQNPVYLTQLLIGGILVLLLTHTLKANHYAGLSLVIGYFLSFYYKDHFFTIFATATYTLILLSLQHLGEHKKSILKGTITGIIAITISHYTTKLIFG